MAQSRPGSSGTPFSGKLLIRIVAGLAIVGLAPLTFMAFRLVDLNRDAMITQVLKSQSMIAASTANGISTYLAGWETIGLTATGYENPRSPESISVLQNLLASREDLVAAVVSDGSGGEVLRAQRHEFLDQINEVLSKVESGTRIVRLQGQPWLVATYPYLDTSSRLRLVIQAGELEDAMRPVEFPEDAQIVLIDTSKGLVLGTVGDLTLFPDELLTAAAFLFAFSSGCLLALFRHPIYGLITYVLLIYLHPPSTWWSGLIPSLRWSLLAASITADLVSSASAPRRA